MSTRSASIEKAPVEGQPEAVTAPWYAVKTRFKCEKYVAASLRRKGIDAYVPLVRKTKRYTRKVKHYDIPLISCYVFVRIDLADRVKVLETQYVCEFVNFGGHIQPIPDEEMDLLRKVVGEIDELASTPATFNEGDDVEVISGNLTGLKGKLISRHGRDEFVVELVTIGYDLRMTIDRRMLIRSNKLAS